VSIFSAYTDFVRAYSIVRTYCIRIRTLFDILYGLRNLNLPKRIFDNLDIYRITSIFLTDRKYILYFDIYAYFNFVPIRTSYGYI